MKLTKLTGFITGFIVVALFSSTTFANTSAVPAGQPYVGFAFTQGGLDLPSINDSVSVFGQNFIVQDESIHQGFGWHVYGGYLFTINPLFSVGPEVGYAQPTKNVYKTAIDEVSLPMTITYSSSYLDLLASGRLHVTSNFDIIGKMGAASVTQDIEFPILGTSTGQQVAPELVIGMAYNVGQNIEVNFVYDTILTDGVNTSDFLKNDKIANINTFNLGINYFF